MARIILSMRSVTTGWRLGSTKSFTFSAQLGFYIAIGYTDDLRNRGIVRFYTNPPR